MTYKQPIAQAHALLMLILGKHRMGIFTLPPADVERIEAEIVGISPVGLREPKPWFIKHRRKLTLTERLRVLAGVPVVVRFDSPDGNCHAACNLTISVNEEEL